MPDEPRTSLLDELKRRRVFRVAGVYIVAGFAVIEGADLVFPRLGLPDWTVTLVVGLILVGFPLAITLAWAFDFTPDGVERTSPAPSMRLAFGTASRIAVVGAVLIIAAAAAGFFLTRGGEVVDLDPDAVAVLPFRVGGAEPSLAYLQEGVVDLLAAKLTGEAGPRAVNPRTMLTAWRSAVSPDAAALPPDEAVDLARRVGAAQVLIGDVVGTADALTLRAELIDAETGESTRAEQSGSVDQLTTMIDRLAATLIALEAGEARPRLEQLTTTSLPALRSYLQGRSAFRAGRYSEAADYFAEAVDSDSTFALAALGMAESLTWWPERPGEENAVRLAWKYRDRLSERDRAYLRAFAGPDYPRPSSRAEHLAAYQRALDWSSDDPMLWYHVGDVFYHSGLQMGVDDALERSAAHLERALDLDPAFAPPAEHLFALALRMGDTARTREVGRRYLAMEADAEGTIRWWLGLVGDASVDSVPTLEDVTRRDLLRIVGWSLDAGLVMDSVERAAAILAERYTQTATPFQADQIREVLAHVEWRRGRYEKARRLSAEPESVAGLHQAVVAGMQPALVPEMIEGARAFADSLTPPAGWRTHVRYLAAVWTARAGDREPARALLAELRSAPDPVDPEADYQRELYARLLAAELAVVDGDPDAADRVAELDVLARQVPTLGPWTELANLTLIRLHEELGDPEAALAAARRRAFTIGFNRFLAVQFREEGRLAELLGRRDQAAQAYRTYLELRAEDADPIVRDEVEDVQAALQRLTAEGR